VLGNHTWLITEVAVMSQVGAKSIAMKTIKSVNVGSLALYGAVLSVFWTFVFGFVY
jgi:hypothetical protein